MSDDNFLSRWSRKKSESKATPAAAAIQPSGGVVPAQAGTQSATPVEDKSPEPLPPVESLTPESDFTPFMKTDVDPATKRQALKALFQDPRFNVMDGLDVYIDDYSKPDPIPAEWLEKMYQVTRLGDFGPKEEARKQAAEAAAAAPSQLDKPAEEQQVATGAEESPSDTSVPESVPSEAGNRPLGKEA